MSALTRTMAILVTVLLLIAGATTLGVVPSYYTGLLVQMLYFAILAMSIDLLVGFTGLASLGHAAFFGISAYTTALLSVHITSSAWIAAPLGILASAVLALIFGVFALRAGGAYFLMITLALAQLVWGAAVGWRGLTGGDDGIPRIPRPRFGDWTLATESSYLLFALVVFGIVLMALVLLLSSPFGRALRGIRESELRMSVLGYDTWRYKYAAFVISGTTAGVGGILFLYFNSFVSPEVVSLIISAEALLMVILGGAGTLFGPIVGAIVVVALRHIASGYTERWLLVLGVIYVMCAVFAPRGIVGELQARFFKRAPE
jgi:branched-chain amino acid transport system permease protein